ncbi:MAG: alpha-glucan family phosphorylase [Pseudomonadales bacterium]|nr:alpha-glucan family phosphorylase [Pseudomonadales bacterium]
MDGTIAYFSMEIALDARMPTYSGGLGVLAGDTLRTAADLGVPMVAVSLLHRRGYFRQVLDADGVQSELPEDWPVADFLEALPIRTALTLSGRRVVIRAWRYWIHGCHDGRVPVLLIDSDLPENAPEDQRLTDHLYGGDAEYRLRQEALLGIGGVRLLRGLGFDRITRFHMNEGHSALLTLELLEEQARANGDRGIGEPEIEAVRAQCVFTTHTPVPAGHDQFPLELADRVLGTSVRLPQLRDVFAVNVYRQVMQTRTSFASPRDMLDKGLQLNLTYVALNLSRYVNGVAERHGEVSRLMFADYTIDAITNGVHAATWVGPAMAELFDRHLAGWQADNFSLRYALGIPHPEIAAAHRRAKLTLLEHVHSILGVRLDPEAFTLGFARRATAYKRPDLLFHDPERLRLLARRFGPLQVVFAGKAHPNDTRGRELIRDVHAAARLLAKDGVRIVYLPNYEIRLARLLVSGVDAWLNTPLPPNEASGTSGMKAAMNGVPSISTLDGWWIEGHLEGITGWSIGSGDDGRDAATISASDAASLYEKLEQVVLPCFYDDPDRFLCIRRNTIALNGSFFNSQRMLQQYLSKAYA